MKIEAFKFDYKSFRFEVLDQRLLPLECKYVDIAGVQDGYRAIKDMLVRGAPCIAAVACLSFICELNKIDIKTFKSTSDLTSWIEVKLQLLKSSRPTAVNLVQALSRLTCDLKIRDLDPPHIRDFMTKLCLEGLEKGRRANKCLGDYGAAELCTKVAESYKLTVLTHCNTGALATVGYGTALGVIRSLHEQGRLDHVYCTETRPYNQGSRLTAWELVQEKIPATLIADSMVAYLMASRKIDAIVVGADRVANNGDTANKIGTLQIAVLARHYGVPFYVAVPTQSIDPQAENANSIKIEQRPGDELRKLGDVQLAPANVQVWNPCFDITPGSLIEGFITEFGICKTGYLVDHMEKSRSSADEVALF